MRREFEIKYGDHIIIRPYGGRYYALYSRDELCAVVLYKKGAMAVAQRLYDMETEIELLKRRQKASEQKGER